MPRATVIEEQSREKVRRLQLEGDAQLPEGVESLRREQPHDCVAPRLRGRGSCDGIPLLGQDLSNLSTDDRFAILKHLVKGKIRVTICLIRPSLVADDTLLVEVAENSGGGELLGQLILVAFQEAGDGS